jgi:serpin B
VDEKGTEAAAVTAVQIDLESMPVYDVEMTFDRPFLYGIVDLESSLPLFTGVLENPVE